MQISEDGNQSSIEIAGADQNILNLLDSMDNYLILVDSLSSSLRRGWLELASARYSMGASRVNSSLFDLKSHHASTTLQVDNAGTDMELPRFTLCKWTSSDEAKLEEDELLKSKSDSPPVQHQESEERKAEGSGSPVTANNHAEKERFKSLSMFGTLVSPKLRATQSTFETALETLVEMSNLRASLLRAYDQEKAPYQAAAEKRKEEYERKMEAYNRKLAGGDDESDKSKSEVNDEDDEEVSGDEDEDDD